MKVIGVCKLCRRDDVLQESHILPRSVLKHLKRDSSGKMIGFDNKPWTNVEYTQNSLWERMLCSECEQHIGRYERYGLEFLRSDVPDKSVVRRSGVALLNHNYHHMKLFFMTFIWKASVSTLEEFEHLFLPDRIQEVLRIAILNDEAMGQYLLGVRLTRLMRRGDALKQETRDSVRYYIMAPRPLSNSPVATEPLVVVFEGYMFEIYIPTMAKSQRNKRGVHKRCEILYVPNKCLFDIEVIMESLVVAYGKEEKGFTKI